MVVSYLVAGWAGDERNTKNQVLTVGNCSASEVS